MPALQASTTALPDTVSWKFCKRMMFFFTIFGFMIGVLIGMSIEFFLH